ncbi:hypothetical protein J1614_009549 [Plenodomus biglobosus]|nr:hypothetical protein J1614_009549 [Plenodomus biglobosus]
MSTTLIATRRPQKSSSSTSRARPSTSVSLRLESAIPSDLFSLIALDTARPTPSVTVTNKLVNPSATSNPLASVGLCSIDGDCATDGTCSDGRCVTTNEAAPFSGPGSEPTSTLSTASAIGVGVGAVGAIALLIGLAFFFWKRRGRRRSEESEETPGVSRHRSPSNATDQKTLVASLPNSPRHADFRNQPMTSDLFAKALGCNEVSREKANTSGQGTTSESYRVEDATGKELPAPPLSENPLPPAPTEPKRYALNVNINKSMIFDDEMISAVSPFREPVISRERAPKYRFEEYLPPVTKPPSISVKPTTNKRLSEHELERYPEKHISIQTATTTDDSSEDEFGSRVNKALSKVESAPPQLPLPDLPPPSPSFSFRSYDWYQDIIGDRTSAYTPIQATFSHLSSSSPPPRGESALVPEPLLLNAPPAAAGSHLHPNSAALPSSSSPSFRLAPTVYMPSRPSQLPAIPPTLPSVSARISTLSTTTRTTHNSQSWLPDEDLYLTEEGTHDSYMRFTRLDDASRPTSYSPLT